VAWPSPWWDRCGNAAKLIMPSRKPRQVPGIFALHQSIGSIFQGTLRLNPGSIERRSSRNLPSPQLRIREGTMETRFHLRRHAAFCLRLSQLCSDELVANQLRSQLPTPIREPCGPSSTSGAGRPRPIPDRAAASSGIEIAPRPAAIDGNDDEPFSLYLRPGHPHQDCYRGARRMYRPGRSLDLRLHSRYQRPERNRRHQARQANGPFDPRCFCNPLSTLLI
jgi:hypothetical protein